MNPSARMNIILLLLVTCLLDNCFAQGSESVRQSDFPSRDVIVERVDNALPEGWKILRVEERAVPPDWFSLEKAGVLIVAGQEEKRLSICVVPRQWIGIRRVRHQPFLDYDKGLKAGRQYKAITAAPDKRTQRALWKAMYLRSDTSIRWECKQIFPRGTWDVVGQKVGVLVEKHCHNEAERDEAAVSLVELGVPALDFFMARAQNGGKHARELCVSALGWLGGEKSEKFLSHILATETDAELVRSAKFGLRRIISERAKNEFDARPKDAKWPARARISYTPRKGTFVLGEPVMVDLSVRNEWEQPLALTSGSDYRGCARPLRFHFVATDDAGQEVRDPFPHNFLMGGIGGKDVLLQGEEFKRHFDLRRWCAFEWPGAYQVIAAQDLGWTAEEMLPKDQNWGPRAIGARFTIHLRQPTEQEMEAIISKKDKNEPQVAGAVSPYLRLLHAPAYLPLLKKRIIGADAEEILRLLPGVRSIESKDATWLLIELLESKHREVRREAARRIGWRLPDPVIYGKARPRSAFRFYSEKERRRLVAKVWDEKMKPGVLAFASRCLEEVLSARAQKKGKMGPITRENIESRIARHRAYKLDVQDIEIASYIVECLGEKEWLRRIIEALKEFSGNSQLLRTAEHLRGEDWSPPGPDSPDAAWIVWLKAARKLKVEEREKHFDTYRTALHHNSTRVQEAALESIPPNAAGRLAARLNELFEVPRLRDEVLETAARCRLMDFRDKGLALLRKTKRFRRKILNAVCALDPQREYVDIMIDHLDSPPNRDIQVWLTMQTVRARSYGSGGEFPLDEARRLKQEWKKWFAEYGEIWKKTGPLPLSDKRLGPRPLARMQDIPSR